MTSMKDGTIPLSADDFDNEWHSNVSKSKSYISKQAYSLLRLVATMTRVSKAQIVMTAGLLALVWIGYICLAMIFPLDPVTTQTICAFADASPYVEVTPNVLQRTTVTTHSKCPAFTHATYNEDSTALSSPDTATGEEGTWTFAFHNCSVEVKEEWHAPSYRIMGALRNCYGTSAYLVEFGTFSNETIARKHLAAYAREIPTWGLHWDGTVRSWPPDYSFNLFWRWLTVLILLFFIVVTYIVFENTTPGHYRSGSHRFYESV